MPVEKPPAWIAARLLQKLVDQVESGSYLINQQGSLCPRMATVWKGSRPNSIKPRAAACTCWKKCSQMVPVSFDLLMVLAPCPGELVPRAGLGAEGGAVGQALHLVVVKVARETATWSLRRLGTERGGKVDSSFPRIRRRTGVSGSHARWSAAGSTRSGPTSEAAQKAR